MIGLFLFVVVSVGLGQFIPAITLAGTPFLGLRFFGGYVAFVLTFVFLHVVLWVPLAPAAWLLVTVAIGGVIWAASKLRRSSVSKLMVFLHPVPILLLIGTAAIFANGGIGYIPYTSDEFTNWLGASRHIFLAGGYNEIRDTIYLSGYTPGWRLALLFPWVIIDSIREGDAAAAPFVALVGLTGIVYDIVLFALRRLGMFSERRAVLLAWVALLAGLAAEIAGATWPRNLLIEPPQIFTIAATLLIIVLISTEKSHADRLMIYAGLMLAGSYIIKTAALAFAPAVGLWILFLARSDGQTLREYVQRVLFLAVLSVGPLIIVATVWKISGSAANEGIPSIFATFSGNYLSNAFVNDWRDLAQRYSGAIWKYAVEYKTPMTVGALFALGIAAVRGRYEALLIWISFATLYFLALYWYHLVFFGEYYFKELNSIPRFSRVPIQVLHVAGFTAAIIELLEFFKRGYFPRISAIVRGRATAFAIGVIAAILVIYQSVQIHRSVVDVTTRKYQLIDPRIHEVKSAVKILSRMAGRELLEKPLLVLISQGMDREPLSFFQYFGRETATKNASDLGFRVFPAVSWTPELPKNAWQEKTTETALRESFAAADMIWPLNLDPWMMSVLADVVDLQSCSQDAHESYFVRIKGASLGQPLRCVPKPHS